MTNPPSVPSLDVEACVRLLTRVAFLIERVGFDLDIAEMVGQEPEEENPPEDINLVEAEQQEQADGLRALASALPGMGKDSELLDTLGRFGWVKAGWGLVPQFEWTRKADDGPGGWARLVSPRLRDAIAAARASQPHETT